LTSNPEKNDPVISAAIRRMAKPKSRLADRTEKPFSDKNGHGGNYPIRHSRNWKTYCGRLVSPGWVAHVLATRTRRPPTDPPVLLERLGSSAARSQAHRRGTKARPRSPGWLADRFCSLADYIVHQEIWQGAVKNGEQARKTSGGTPEKILDALAWSPRRGGRS